MCIMCMHDKGDCLLYFSACALKVHAWYKNIGYTLGILG